MREIITIRDSQNQRAVISIGLKNLPMAIFYGVVAVLWMLFVFKVASLGLAPTTKAQWSLFLPIAIVLLYLILKSEFGKARFIIDKEHVYLFEGVFGIGRKRKIYKQDIDKIYVRRIENGGGLNEYNHRSAKEIKQCICIEALGTYKFVHNQIATDDLHHFCDKINEELDRLPPTTLCMKS